MKEKTREREREKDREKESESEWSVVVMNTKAKKLKWLFFQISKVSQKARKVI